MLSVITVVYNDKTGVEATIKSVLEQDFNNFEFIIVDGGSLDGTVEAIKSFESSFKFKNICYKYISENDDGIYDAMNKGVSISRGEWTTFMNAGDTFYSSSTLSTVFNQRKYGDYGVIYGDALFDDNGHQYIFEGNEIKIIRKMMPFCHQASFIRRELLVNSPYSLNYSIVSDYHFFLKQYFSAIKFKKIEEIVAIHDMSGISNTNAIKGHKEKIMIKNEFVMFESKFDEWQENFTFYLKYFIKKSIGRWLVGLIRKIKSEKIKRFFTDRRS